VLRFKNPLWHLARVQGRWRIADFERWIVKHLEGYYRSIIDVISQDLPGMTEKNH